MAFKSHKQTTFMMLATAGLLTFLTGCVPVEHDGWYGSGQSYGGSGGRLYAREQVRHEWIGATQGEVLDHWGEPYERAYWNYETAGNQTYGYGPYMAYVEVVREPYRGRPGAVEHISFVLDQDFRRVVRVEFSDEVDWWGGDVEIFLFDEDEW